MNLKLFRKIHLYLGCFFAPLLVFFVLTGLLQTFELHEGHKNGYQPPAFVKSLADVHKNQRFSAEGVRPPPSEAFRWFVVLMAIGLLINILLGILMAFKFADPRAVWIVVILGIVVPVLILSMPWWHKT
jgi:hypothetical protein